MKKSEFKKLLKPIVKECVKDVLLKEGFLSKIVSEVAKGLSSSMITEVKAPSFDNEQLKQQKSQVLEEQRRRLKAQKRKMLDATGFGTNIFEGTEPISQAHASQEPGGALSGMDPNDSGIDLSGIVAITKRNWKDMI
jgi:hypothetical protein